MIRGKYFLPVAMLAGALLFGGWAASQGWAQSADPQAQPKVSTEQQKPLGQLKQLEEQLQKDREALHAAITAHGWHSDQADAAQEQLFRDRSEYRKLRRSLQQSGVDVAPPARLGRGMGMGMGGPQGGRWGRRGRGYGHGMCDCPCRRTM